VSCICRAFVVILYNCRTIVAQLSQNGLTGGNEKNNQPGIRGN
jgi:hypothetical protein